MLFYRNELELLEEKGDQVVVKVTMSRDKYLTMTALSPKQKLMNCFTKGMSILASAREAKCDQFYAKQIYEEWLKSEKNKPEKTEEKKWKKSRRAYWNTPEGIKHREKLSKRGRCDANSTG